VVPESPRWLLTKGKYAEAYKIFHRIAKSNKKPTECLRELELLRGKVSAANVISPLFEEEDLAAMKIEGVEPVKKVNSLMQF
jgi:hypothetical protein